MQQFNPIGQPQERDLNSLKYINNLDEMEQQLTILESLGANSSNLVSSISSTPRPKILCKCGCGNLIDKYDKYGRPRKRVIGHTKYWLNKKRDEGTKRKISDKKKLLYKLGLIKITSWNKGLTKENDERIKKISEKKKGMVIKSKLTECSYCNKEFYMMPSYLKRNKNYFCSKLCYKQYCRSRRPSERTKLKMSLIKKGKSNPKGSETLKRLHKEGKLKTWNKGTRGIMKAWNKGIFLSKEHKLKLKEARKYQILPIKDTSIEIKIQNFLKELNIEFFTHQYIKIEHGYQCDILIPSLNLVVEADGNYWHKYPIGNDLDHIRTKELLEKGFKVLRLWEVEIKELDINGFKELIYNIK